MKLYNIKQFNMGQTKYRIKWISIVLVFFALVSCEDSRPPCVCEADEINVNKLKSNDDRESVFVSKQRLTLRNKPYTGKIIECYDGKMRFRGTLKDGYLSGLGQFNSGDVTNMNFKNGLLDGKWESYSTDRTLKVEGQFKNHKQHGTIRNYLNGILWQKGEYKNDLLEGEYYIYKKDGSIKTVVHYKKGIVKNCIGDCDEFNIGDDSYMMGYTISYR